MHPCLSEILVPLLWISGVKTQTTNTPINSGTPQPYTLVYINIISVLSLVKKKIIVRSGTALIRFSSTLLTKYIFCRLKYIFG